jgi:RNA polymerase sigma-70 factor (ECF subfamily)
MGQEEADLIRRWKQGEPAAFEALVRRWQQPVARFLFRLIGQAEQVQDLCQEVFLRAYLATSRYRETGAFSTWLYRIALNVARDTGRRRRHEPGPLPGTDLADGTASKADELCQQKELAAAVGQAVAALPDSLREVLVLRHYEGLSFESMGRLLHMPASTLKSRFTAALQRLKQHLSNLGWSDEELP